MQYDLNLCRHKVQFLTVFLLNGILIYWMTLRKGEDTLI